jgi:hypothetical protein
MFVRRKPKIPQTQLSDNTKLRRSVGGGSIRAGAFELAQRKPVAFPEELVQDLSFPRKAGEPENRRFSGFDYSAFERSGLIMTFGNPVAITIQPSRSVLEPRRDRTRSFNRDRTFFQIQSPARENPTSSLPKTVAWSSSQ